MTKKPFSQIAWACFLAGLISTIMVQRIGLKYFYGIIPARFMAIISVTYLVAILVYIFTGLRTTVKAQGQSPALLAFWQDALRYFLALDMMIFGVCKFFKLQFVTPLALLDNPFNTWGDSELMWAFFGHSYPFTLLIGSLEIIGALLLLFKKTRLVAVFFLMPICLNIFFLDVFYNGVATSVYIGIEIIGLTYLLLIEYDRLYKFFFIDKSDLPQFKFKNDMWRNMVKLSVVVITFGLMAINKYPQYYPEINGKYMVKGLIIDNVKQEEPCKADSVLTKVYIDKNDIVLEYNSYRRRFIGNYKYNQATKQITATWRYPGNQHDTLFAKILPGGDAEKKILTGYMGKQTFKVDLHRVNKGI